MTRNRKKSERGYTREKWIQHHKRIVEISERRQNLTQEETEKKIWGLNVESSIIMDQDGEVRSETTLSGEEKLPEELKAGREGDSPKVQNVRVGTVQNRHGDRTKGKIVQDHGCGTGDTSTSSTKGKKAQ